MSETLRPPALGDYLTVGDAARLLGVSASTLRRWGRAGKLTSARHPVNGYRLYRREDLEALLIEAAARPDVPASPTPATAAERTERL